MLPTPNPQKPGTSGIARVVEAYYRYLPDYDVQLVSPDSGDYDLAAVHISAQVENLGAPLVLHNHGIHWTADYICETWQYNTNAKVIHTLRYAREVTVPSAWVAETFQRDMRFTPHIVPHGIDWFEWENNLPTEDYILWNKNRGGQDVCDPTPVLHLARQFRDNRFATTYLPRGIPIPNNISPPMKTIPYPEMKKIVQRALIYLSTTKETFGIGVLEAMASGVPVLGFAHGGNVDLIRHGETGYLAKPGDFDDLAEGLAFCLRYRDTLGENGREAARGYSWRDAVEQVAGVYRLALEPEPPTVAVVIPVYNKTKEQVRRAIQSVIGQTYNRIASITVVDDGSENKEEVEKAVADLRSGDGRINFIRQSNRGVAVARNRGVSSIGSTYVCCLDADDEIQPGFIETCVNALEKDPSLGIAYTAILDVFPDGRTAVPQWPPEFSYDNQLRKQNQIPTCCVFRRKMWERLGGYNQKYAPDGCGAEDAELWLRAGAYGWNAKKVTDEPLFIYHLGGYVTGNPNYQEPPWLDMHPWTQDRLHPFASVAKPAKLSHPVRQYDEPTVSVIIPVGPGHEGKVRDALNSLEAQTFRKWEAIVVWDAIGKADKPSKILKAYPYIRFQTTYSGSGQKDRSANDGYAGPGTARNRGAEIARAPFLLFLDADDELYPTHIEKHLKAWKDYQAIIYSDYVGKTFIETPADLDPVLLERLYHRNERTGEVIIGHRTADYDCERAQAQPEGHQPYLWCNVTALVPKTWHDEIGGFDESMSSWEDVDYHWRLAKAGHCYHRIPEELMVYRFHTGHRRERGRQDHKNLLQYLADKHKEIEIVPCSGCGGRRNRAPAQRSQSVPVQKARQVESMRDDDYVQAQYIGKRGNHQVTGGFIFPERLPGMKMINRGRGWSIDYGPRISRGRILLVHRADIQAMPGRFIPVPEDLAATAPPPQKEPLPAPERITGALEPLLPQDDIVERDATPPPTDWRQNIATDVIAEQSFDFQRLPGVGPSLAQQFIERGLMTKRDVLALGVDGLTAFSGVGETKAKLIIRALEDAD